MSSEDVQNHVYQNRGEYSQGSVQPEEDEHRSVEPETRFTKAILDDVDEDGAERDRHGGDK